MSNGIITNTIFGTALSMATGMWTPALHADQPIDRQSPATADGTVDISSVSGRITVTGWDRNEIQLTGSIDEDARLVFRNDGDRTLIQVKNAKGFGGDDALLNVSAPLNSRLTVSTVSAEVRVEGIHGEQKLQSVSGDIATQIWSDDLGIHTVSGDLTVRGHGGSGVISMDTVSGTAHLSGTGGEITASTVSGDLKLELTTVTRARLRTTSGDVELHTALAPTARIDAEAVSGDMEMTLAGARQAEYHLETFSGDIVSCFGTAARISSVGPGTELRFREGDGEARVRAKSLSGDIRLCDK